MLLLKTVVLSSLTLALAAPASLAPRQFPWSAPQASSQPGLDKLRQVSSLLGAVNTGLTSYNGGAASAGRTVEYANDALNAFDDAINEVSDIDTLGLAWSAELTSIALGLRSQSRTMLDLLRKKKSLLVRDGYGRVVYSILDGAYSKISRFFEVFLPKVPAVVKLPAQGFEKDFKDTFGALRALFVEFANSAGDGAAGQDPSSFSLQSVYPQFQTDNQGTGQSYPPPPGQQPQSQQQPQYAPPGYSYPQQSPPPGYAWALAPITALNDPTISSGQAVAVPASS